MSENKRYPHLYEFLKHIRVNNNAARNTVNGYEDDLKHFFEWFITNYGYNDVTLLTTDHIRKFRDFLQTNSYATSTIARRFASLSQFIGYLVQSDIISEDNDPWPKRIAIRGEEKLPHLVLNPIEVFRIRLKQNIRLEWAWFFEIALSTGMRSDEIMQLRARDLIWQAPFDKELMRPSPYFVGTINLTPDKISIKRNRPRTVYFSFMAGELTKAYLAKHHIDPASNTPLLPYTRTNPQSWMKFLGEGIVNVYNQKSVGTGIADGEKQRDRYCTDINPDELNVDEKFKALIKRRQQESEGVEEYKRQTKKMRVRRRNLHPHSLRHSFTSFMYYRNALGERHADSTLRILLGHQKYSTTFIYLRDLPLVDNDSTWTRLWLGKPQDWAGINR